MSLCQRVLFIDFTVRRCLDNGRSDVANHFKKALNDDSLDPNAMMFS